jgi:hypothetical protein
MTAIAIAFLKTQKGSLLAALLRFLLRYLLNYQHVLPEGVDVFCPVLVYVKEAQSVSSTCGLPLTGVAVRLYVAVPVVTATL